jgi:hypothetical protein
MNHTTTYTFTIYSKNLSSCYLELDRLLPLIQSYRIIESIVGILLPSRLVVEIYFNKNS